MGDRRPRHPGRGAALTSEPAWDQLGQYADDDEDRAPSWPIDDEETERLPVRDTVPVEEMVAMIRRGR